MGPSPSLKRKMVSLAERVIVRTTSTSTLDPFYTEMWRKLHMALSPSPKRKMVSLAESQKGNCENKFYFNT